VRLLVPAGRAAAAAVRVEIETAEDPGTRRDPPDQLHVGSQWVLVERLPATQAEAAIDALLAQTAAEQQAEEFPLDGWWHAAASLYVARRVTRAELAVGPRDEAQLGPGWYHREDWGQHGAIRWTGPEALVYLAAPGGATTLRIASYSGEARLGGVAGRVLVEHAAPGEGFAAAGETPFALPPDAWEELHVPVPPARGQLRVTLRIDAPRVPRLLIPGSQDDRRLGLAVRRLALG
jgi:hypothetical protein